VELVVFFFLLWLNLEFQRLGFFFPLPLREGLCSSPVFFDSGEGLFRFFFFPKFVAFSVLFLCCAGF